MTFCTNKDNIFLANLEPQINLLKVFKAVATQKTDVNG